MAQRRIIILVAIIALAVAGALAWFGNRKTEPIPQAIAGPLPPETIGADELRVLGNRKARVTLIEYAALTCPICAAFSQQVFPAFKARYIDTGKVLYVYRLLPIDPADGKAEKLASCLPPAQYFSFVDLLYRRQDDWGPEQHGEHGAIVQPKTDAGLEQMGRIVGLSADKARACMTDAALDGRINQTAADGVARYQLHATPTLIINGHAEPAGLIPMERLQALIDPILAGK